MASLKAALDWLSTASSARLTDYLLGGKDNYPPDRALAKDLGHLARSAMVVNRAFGAATARWAARRGIRQFLDLGCGYPTPWANRGTCDNVHQAIAGTCAGAPVVYVDFDPVAMPHCRAQLLGDGPPHRVTCVEADVRSMEKLLADPGLVDALDRGRPIAVSVHDVLPWITDDDTARHSMRVLRDWLPVGSVLSTTHLTPDWRPDEVAALTEVCEAHSLPVRPRTLDEVAAFFGTWSVLADGLKPPTAVHTALRQAQIPPEESLACAGIAVKTR